VDVLVRAVRQTLDDRIDKPSPTADTGLIRVLIIDDDPEVLSLVSEFLQGRGYMTQVASSAREGLDCIIAGPRPDLVLLDISMPEMGGIEALKVIVAQRHHPTVIMISALIDREIALHALAMGAFDYVVKPFEMPILEESILAALSSARYRQQPWWKRLARRAGVK
jgi:DNA-binding response OmpR family regulator